MTSAASLSAQSLLVDDLRSVFTKLGTGAWDEFLDEGRNFTSEFSIIGTSRSSFLIVSGSP